MIRSIEVDNIKIVNITKTCSICNDNFEDLYCLNRVAEFLRDLFYGKVIKTSYKITSDLGSYELTFKEGTGIVGERICSPTGEVLVEAVPDYPMPVIRGESFDKEWIDFDELLKTEFDNHSWEYAAFFKCITWLRDDIIPSFFNDPYREFHVREEDIPEVKKILKAVFPEIKKIGPGFEADYIEPQHMGTGYEYLLVLLPNLVRAIKDDKTLLVLDPYVNVLHPKVRQYLYVGSGLAQSTGQTIVIGEEGLEEIDIIPATKSVTLINE